MTQISKPSFPPGWVLPEGARILKRIDKQQFIEVFHLDNDEYLYLFHDKEIVKKLKKRDVPHEVLFAGGVEIIGKRYSDHKEGDIPERLKNLIQRRGLEAIAGMVALKNTLIRDVIQPFLNWEAYEKYGVTPSNGILFFGPPGCGKTFITRKIAEAMRAEIIELSEGTVGSPFIHATSKNIVEAFQNAEQIAPCILFVDELSGLMPRRDGLGSHEHYREAEINEFLMLMEGCVKKKVLVIGATNFPEKIDPAILRSGRMDKRIFIPPPDTEARCELFQLMLEERPVEMDIDYNELAQLTDGLISSDVKLIVNNSALRALQDNVLISMKLLREECVRFKPSLNTCDLEKYLKFQSYERV